MKSVGSLGMTLHVRNSCQESAGVAYALKPSAATTWPHRQFDNLLAAIYAYCMRSCSIRQWRHLRLDKISAIWVVAWSGLAQPGPAWPNQARSWLRHCLRSQLSLGSSPCWHLSFFNNLSIPSFAEQTAWSGSPVCSAVGRLIGLKNLKRLILQQLRT